MECRCGASADRGTIRRAPVLMAKREREERMKALLTMCVLVAAVIGVQAEAFAQVQKAPVYRYCLLEIGGGIRGGGGSMLCRFNTFAQCMASRTGHSDSCIINPELTFVK
jgi:hypothetical protein